MIEQMMGYSLKVSELKEPISDQLIEEALELDYPQSYRCILESLGGAEVFYTSAVCPWRSVSQLIEAVGEEEPGTLIHGGGYPFIFTALGATVVSEIGEAKGSRHGELEELVHPERIYLIEVWELNADDSLQAPNLGR